MAKPRHLSKARQSSRTGRLGPRRRVDITYLSKKQQRERTAFALRIQDLVAMQERGELADDVLQAAAVELKRKPWELTEAMEQFRSYHTAYPDEHPANAFMPTTINQASEKKPPPSDSPTESELAHIKRPPSRGQPIALVLEPEQSRIKAFAERIHDLNKLKEALGRVPHNERERAAAEFGCTPDWIGKNMRLQRKYMAAYPDEPFYNAHTPRQIGRPRGRNVPDEVRNTIEEARINKRWLSRDGAGNYDEFHNGIEKKLIHSLVVQHFGEIHSGSTTYRIIRDYEERRAARVHVADEDVGELQNHLPAISNKARGPGDRAQFDVRPFPVVVDNDGVYCSVHGLLVFDDYAGHILSWEILPAKRIDDEGEIHKQTFKDQLSRAVVARGVMGFGRVRTFYADHGFEAFKRHMEFMVARGEEQTQLIHSRVARPRGRGTVERGGQLVDGFLKTRPYYVRERDFRRSRTKKRSDIRTFAQFREDFATYVYHWNNDPAPGGGLSRIELLKQGPSFFLSAPAPENLAMFAMSQRRKQCTPRHEGDVWFWLERQGYEAYRRDAAIYTQFADLSRRGSKIDVAVFDFGLKPADQLVLFSLDGEQTWEMAVPAGSREISGRRHTEILIEVEQQMERDDAASLDAFFQKVLLRSANGPLVLNGLARERHFYYHTPAAPEMPSEDRLALLDEMLFLPGAATPEVSSEGLAVQDLSADASALIQASTQPPIADTGELIQASTQPRKSNRSRKTKTATNVEPPVPTGDTEKPLETASHTPNIIELLLKRRQQEGT